MKKLYFLLLVFTIPRAGAQQIHQALASGGGNASGANGSVSYTIGQMLYTTTSGGSGSSAAGVQTTFNLSNPLPVKLVDFTGQCTGSSVQLNWQTATEENNEIFSVERSDDASTWVSITTIKSGNASKDYSYTDGKPTTPISYYRLKLVDANETAVYSPVLHVLNCAAKAKPVVIYPNPTATGVYVTTEDGENTEFELYDMKGTVMCKGKMQHSANYIDMSLLAAGLYHLKLKQNNTQINSFNILKN